MNRGRNLERQRTNKQLSRRCHFTGSGSVVISLLIINIANDYCKNIKIVGMGICLVKEIKIKIKT